MISSMQIYWLSRLSFISNFFTFLTVVLTAAAIITTVTKIVFYVCDNEDDETVRMGRVWKWVLIAWLVSILGAAFIPDSKDVAAIYVVPKIANSETVQELGDKTKTLAIEWLEELRPKQKKILKENKENKE